MPSLLGISMIQGRETVLPYSNSDTRTAMWSAGNCQHYSGWHSSGSWIRSTCAETDDTRMGRLARRHSRTLTPPTWRASAARRITSHMATSGPRHS